MASIGPIKANVIVFSPFRPRQWRGAVIFRSDIARLEVLRANKQLGNVNFSANFTMIFK